MHGSGWAGVISALRRPDRDSVRQWRRPPVCGAPILGRACARRRSTVPAVLAVLSGLPRDAVLLADRRTATPADIDIAMRLGAGHPAGPFEVLAGLDADRRRDLGLPARLPEAFTSDAGRRTGMAAVEDDPRLRPAATLTDLLAAGRLGRRPGAGFHTY
jgi:3-hydroxyacyl-CoA dehydrogenase